MARSSERFTRKRPSIRWDETSIAPRTMRTTPKSASAGTRSPRKRNANVAVKSGMMEKSAMNTEASSFCNATK